jgi:hypothetical protein
MKQIFNKGIRLSAQFVNQHAELFWVFAASINNLFSFIITFVYLVLDYITNLVGSVFFSVSANKLDSAEAYVKNKFNFSFFSLFGSTNTGSSNTSPVPVYIEKTLEICFLVGFLEILYSFFFLGSAVITLSNESLWLLSLTAAVLGGNKYYQVVYGAQKNSLEVQIDAIAKLITQNAELAEEIAALEASMIAEQIALSELLAGVYGVISEAVNIVGSEASTKSSEQQFKDVVNTAFAEQFKYLASVYTSRDSSASVIALKDLNDEIITETIDELITK